MNKEDKLDYYVYTLNMTNLNILAIILFIIVGDLIYLIERHDNYSITLSMTNFIIISYHHYWIYTPNN